MSPTKAVIREFVNGNHGEAELRTVGEYLLENWEDDDPALAVRLCDYLADAAKTVKAALEPTLAQANAG